MALLGQCWIRCAAATLLLAASLGAQTLTPTLAAVPYGSHPLEKMDVYLQSKASPTNLTSVLVEIHAGGWAGGSKSFFPVYGGLIEAAYLKGLAIVSIDYPLAPQDVFPAANLSCQRAIQFVRSKAKLWNLNPDRIGVIGASSGAHLAMWVAMAADAMVPMSPDVVKRYSSRVKCCIAYAGPSDLTDTYYKFDPSVGHGVSPVWQFLGASSELQWEAIPPQTKNNLSPRWHALNTGGIDASVRFLGIFKGIPSVTSSSMLVAPEGDIHALIQGLLMKETLESIGAVEAAVWVAPVDYLNGTLYAGDFAVDWLAINLTDAQVRTYGNGTAGCLGTQFLTALSDPKIGNGAFQIASYDGWPFVGGFLVASDKPVSGSPLSYTMGIEILVDLASPSVVGFNLPVSPAGKGLVSIPIPNDPSLINRTFYFQSFSSWNDPSIPSTCLPSPLKLSSSNGLAVTIRG